MKRRFVTLPEIRKIIKDRRLALGYSLQDLGSMVDIDRNTIKLMEDGKINDPGFSRILKILHALGLDASSIMASPSKDSHLEQIVILIKQESLFNIKQKEMLVTLIQKQIEKNGTKIKTILIVDDQEIFLKGAKAMIEKKGFTVETATNYKSCLESLTNTIPDLILLDIDLKEDKNGLDLLTSIKKQYPSIPCVMLTGIRNQQIAQEALTLGAFDYIDKNEDMDKIFYIIPKIEEFDRMRDSYKAIEDLVTN